MSIVYFDKELKGVFDQLAKAKLLEDGKALADVILLATEEEIRAKFELEKYQQDFKIEEFFQRYFRLVEPTETAYVSDTSRPVKEHIEALWEVLRRDAHISQRETHSTLIPLPYSYVVPGGRFNEIYYWDSYFTMLGLRTSGKIDLVQAMIDNFTFLIDHYGHIPNGNRSYFLTRSQPPFFALMVALLAEELGTEIYKKYASALQKEYNYWMKDSEQLQARKASNHSVGVGQGVLNRYYDNLDTPRTEMYAVDLEFVQHHKSKGTRLLSEIRAACESGWDFSSRWCGDPMDLNSIHTTDILPVDLNCLLYNLEDTLSRCYGLLQNKAMAQIFAEKARIRASLIQATFWNPQTDFYHDWDWKKEKHTPSLSLAAVFPLYFKLAKPEQAVLVSERLRKDFLAPGGLVTTTMESGQQWDAPNGWAPLQWMAIQGLRNYGLNDLADEVKRRWVNINTTVFKNTGKLMEKYNVSDLGLESGGGEYPVQDGFGWTNGVLLALLSE